MPEDLPKAERRLLDIEGQTGERPEGRLPDFLLLGAQKCGTGFLYRRLCRHPNVEPAVVKEVDFFSKHFDRGVGWYRSCFPSPDRAGTEPSRSWEGSPNYLFYPHAAVRAAGVVPRAKLVVLLRNPVDRAYSHYHHQRRMGHEPLPTFEEALEAEERRLSGVRQKMLEDENYLPVEFPRFSYVGRGLYAEQLEEWRRHFHPDRMLVVGSEDLYENTRKVLAGIVRFVGLPAWEPGDELLTRRPVRYSYGPMDPATRERLERFFGPHNGRLYDLLGRDFGW